MYHKVIVAFFVSLFLSASPVHADDSARQQAEAAAAMAAAQAEKTRQDAIVQKQREAEAKAKAEKARKDTEEIEKACLRARTC